MFTNIWHTVPPYISKLKHLVQVTVWFSLYTVCV